MQSLPRQNYYEVLDVSLEATLPELERAYRIARTTYHPGSVATYSVFTDQDSSEIMRRVEEAYAVLSDARMRREYDSRLAYDEQSRDRARPADSAYDAPPAIERAAASVLDRGFDDAHIAAPIGTQLSLPGVETGPPEYPAPAELSPSAARSPVSAPTPPAPAPQLGRELGLDSELDEGLDPTDGVFDGPVLRRIRMSRGVELEEISHVTKINELYLQFLEENRFHELPSPVYVRGWLKEYAKCLRLDPQQVASTYLERLKQRAESPGRRS